MDVSRMTRENARLQQYSVNNFFDLSTLFQGYFEWTWRYWNYKLGMRNGVHAAVDQFWTFMMSEHQDFRKLIDEYFKRLAE